MKNLENKVDWFSPVFIKMIIILYIFIFVFQIVFGYYIISYVIFIVLFLIIVINFHRLDIFKWFESRPLFEKVMIIFLMAFILRFLLLFQDQMVTRDIELYVQRSEWMIQGLIPYEDFHVNKPPLYAYMLQFLGTVFGTGEVQFRAFFTVMDSLVAILIYYMCKIKFDSDFSLKASFAYVICPLPIMSIGLAGHYEPVVMIFVLLSIISLLKHKYPTSALFLGIGFAFKFFPIVLLPFFAWRIKTWKNRIIYIILFGIPFLLSLIPILLMSSSAFGSYMYEQTYSWEAKKSFAFIFEMLIGSRYIYVIKISLITTVVFMLLILVMFISWLRKKFDATFWFKVMVFLYIIYFGLFVIAGLIFYQSEFGIENPIPLMIIFSIIYFLLFGFILNKYLKPLNLKIEKSEEFFILCAFAIFFLIFSSSQFNPWYLIWPLPFVLAIKNKTIKFILLWLMFWNLEGIGIQLLPGLVLV